MQVILEAEKATKNTVRYAEVGDEKRVGMLYMPKDTLAALGNPHRLVLTLEAAPVALAEAA
jgi:hypothetical protein